MDETLKKIERLLDGTTPKSRISGLLPQNVAPPQPEQDMAITHLSKGAAARATAAAPAEAQPAAREQQPRRDQPPAEEDLYKKISAGGREFSLDELGGPESEGGTEVIDPLMGPMLKPASSYRDVSLDELDVNITPDGPKPL
jgi:hypothetical protein